MARTPTPAATSATPSSATPPAAASDSAPTSSATPPVPALETPAESAPAPTPAAPTVPIAEEPTAVMIAVRILRDHEQHSIDDVVELTLAEVRDAKESGWADPDPAAVAYARSLAG